MHLLETTNEAPSAAEMYALLCPLFMANLENALIVPRSLILIFSLAGIPYFACCARRLPLALLSLPLLSVLLVPIAQEAIPLAAHLPLCLSPLALVLFARLLL